MLCVLAWSVLVAVRADDYILWNWHAIYSPMYFAYAWILCGFLSTDYLKYRLDNQVGLQGQITVNAESVMTLILEEFSLGLGKCSLYVGWALSLAWLILVADYQNYDSKIVTAGGSAVTLIPFLFVIFWILFVLKLFHSYDKAAIAAFCLFVCSCITWIYLPIWLKADNWTVPSFTWWAAFHPLWMVLFFLLFVLIPATLFTMWAWLWSNELSFYTDEGQLVFGLGVCGWSFVAVFVWVGFLAANFEWEDHNQPTWLYVIVFIPLFAAEIAILLGCLWWDKWMREH